MNRFFTRGKSTNSNLPVSDVSTVIWVSQHTSLTLVPDKEDKSPTIDLIVKEIKEALSTLKPPTTKQIYSSYQAFKDSFEELSSTGFPSYNCFTYISVPTECIKEETALVTNKQLTWINKQVPLLDYQFQSFLILNAELDVEKPIAHIAGKTYKPLALLLANQKPNLESAVKEIIKLYKNHVPNYEKNPSYKILNGKKTWTNLVDILKALSSQKTESLQENFLKQAVLNLLTSAASLKLTSSYDVVSNKALLDSQLSETKEEEATPSSATNLKTPQKDRKKQLP